MEPVDIRGDQPVAEMLEARGKHDIAVMEGLYNQQYATMEQHRLGRKPEQQSKGGITPGLYQCFGGVVADSCRLRNQEASCKCRADRSHQNQRRYDKPIPRLYPLNPPFASKQRRLYTLVTPYRKRISVVHEVTPKMIEAGKSALGPFYMDEGLYDLRAPAFEAVFRAIALLGIPG